MNKAKLGFDASVYESSLAALAQVIEATIIGTVNTCEVVRVVSVDKEKGTLTAIPEVKNMGKDDIATEESPIYNLKYFGWQFGKCAIKAEPKEDDIGFVVVSKRDISNIKSGVVGSRRKFNLADGIFIGGLVGFNESPTDYIEFNEKGITITSKKDIIVNAKKVEVNAENDVDVKAKKVNVMATQEINLGGSAVKLAKDGDVVMAGNTPIGNIKASDDTIVKTI